MGKITKRKVKMCNLKMQIYKQCFVLCVVVVYMFIFLSSGLGKMIQMDDAELSEVTGGGFSKVELINDGQYTLTRMQFNVQVETFANIDSLKMGYWDNGQGLGWDQDWTNVQLGSSTSDLRLEGFVFEARFSNINDAANRQLEEVKIGYKRAYGNLSADFQSLSKLGALPREYQGVKSFHFNGDPLILTIKCTGTDAGIWFDFGNAQAQ